MKSKLFVFCLVAVLMVTLIGCSPKAQTLSTADVVKKVQSLAMFQGGKYSVHYVAPRTDQIVSLLEENAIPLPNADVTAAAVQAFQTEWAKRNPTTPRNSSSCSRKSARVRSAPRLTMPPAPPLRPRS